MGPSPSVFGAWGCLPPKPTRVRALPRPAFLHEVRAQLANYKRFRRLVHQWIHLSLELSRDRLAKLKRAVSD